MGLFDSLVNRKKGDSGSVIPTDGEHNIKDVFIASPGAITPNNLNLATVAEALHVPPIPTFVDGATVDHLEVVVADKKERLAFSKRAYELTVEGMGYDTELHKIHRGAQVKAMDHELARQTENAKVAEHAHRVVRPGYAGLGGQVQRAERSGNEAVRLKKEANGTKR